MQAFKPQIELGTQVEQKTLNVVFVIYENALSTAISLPIELLKSADNISKSKAYRETHAKPIKLHIQLASIDGKPKLTQTGIEIQADLSIGDIEHADIVFLPAMWRNPFPVLAKNEGICNWVKNMFSRETTRIAGVGTGCAFIAEAGLLDGKVATTHWYFFDQFEKRYPLVKLQRNYFITQSDRIYCTGSVNTLADLTVHFIDQYYGERISTEVERHFFHDVRRNYKKLALLDDASHLHHDEEIAFAQSYLRNHLQDEINMNTLAATLSMSRRNFDRRFKAMLDQSPLSYLQKLRVEAAQDLLKNTNLNISDIVFEIGYQDTAHFSSIFKRINGTTPAQYRSTVRAKLFQTN